MSVKSLAEVRKVQKSLQLVNGKIPPKTECPFATKCAIKTEGNCKHKGVEHPAPFSCATARGFDLVQSLDDAFNIFESDPSPPQRHRDAEFDE